MANELQIGKIEELNGAVTVTHVDGTSESLAIGGHVFQGDVITTGPSGSVGVILAVDSDLL